MSLATLSTANLNSLIALVKKREALQIEIAKVEEEIQAAVSPSESGSSEKATTKVRKTRGRRKAVKAAPVAEKAAPKAAAPVAKASKPAKKGKRGALKEAILAELKAAGSKGAAVKDLSVKLGVKNQNLHVWFATTGKSVKGLKKTGTGTWSYAG
jgi:hypothetical protein